MSEVKNKMVFKARDENGVELDLAIVRPNQKQVNDGQKEYNKAFREAVDSRAILRARVDQLMREQKLWDDDKQARFDSIQKILLENERKLAVGGIKLSEAKKLAIEMRAARVELRGLLTERNELDANTAEAQAYNARFNYYVSCCVVYNNDKKPYFSSYEDYLKRGDGEVGVQGAMHLAMLLHGMDPDYENKLPENQFLTKHKFVDDKLRLVNKEGHLVDVAGKLINGNGHYVNEKDELIDRDGNLVDEQGNYKVDSKPFLDDDGQPVS
jgi:hypothetical protein